MSTQPENEFAARWVNLADPRLGAKVVHATDEFFAPAERMLNHEPAVFVPGKYDDHGKWMDGWESRRKRVEGHDHCIVRLALPGIVKGVDIDTDGGVARLRVYGEVARDWTAADRSTLIDLAAIENGGRAIACSDEHYGTPMNLLFPGRGATMGDGWETRRRREPGNEWAIIALGHAGRIARIEVDTARYKGNYPDRCSILAAQVAGGTEASLVTQSMFWRTLLPEQKLQMDKQHGFAAEVADLGPITHVRFNIIPDGGVMRLRLFGSPDLA